MPVPKEILTLVEHFKRKREELKSAGYKEAQLRVEFLDPLLEALGWDMRNAQGHAEALKEVIHEDAIRIGDFMKAPDYCMKIGRDRKFFVEAKKPSVDVKDAPAAALQLRRYAWSAKLPLSILTDFEEFAIYDCRIRPHKADKASTARIFFCTFEEYAERWDEIAAIFSKEAVLKGSFDKYAGEKRRGTQEVDDEFLKEIEHWRELLAKNIATRNSSLGQQEMNYAVQQTIDRIIFLRICEDRGLETYGRLQAELNGSGIYGRLTELFREADARYNSGLFHFKEEKDQGEPPDTVTPHLTIDDAVLNEIITRLYPPDSPYAFSVIPSEILGQVYEQFLGKVIRLTEGHHAKVEEKPEVRKAGGVYYTPKYIVDYIVEHTIGKLLEGKKPKQVSEIKIVDPACGSGSFLLGAYQLLLDWHLRYYTEHDSKKWKKELYKTKAGDYRLSSTERKRILLNNIFGVDIDAQAVEVTKLSLLLKVLEDETGQTMQQQLSSMRERVLPDLGKNIQCGNSLIGPDFYDGEQQALLETEDADRQRINVFDWEAAFPDVFKRKNPGFDAVIGNPPYVLMQELNQPAVFSYFSKKYKAARYKIDTYHVFVEKGLSLAKQNGFLGYITPNSFLRNKHAKELRQILLSSSEIEQIRLFYYSVFKGASVDTVVIVLKRAEKPNPHHEVKIIKSYSPLISTNEPPCLQKSWIKHPEYHFGVDGTSDSQDIINCIQNNSIQLGDFATAYFGIQTFDRGQFVSNKQGKGFRPVIDGGNISPYHFEPPHEYVQFIPEAIKSGGKEHVYEQERIVMRQIGSSPVATIAPAGLYTLNTIYNVFFTRNSSYDLHFILALFLSKLGKWYWQQMFFDQKRTFPKIKKEAILSFPIPKIDSKQQRNMHDQIVTLVGQMISFQAKLLTAKTPHDQESLRRQIEATDRKIDELVYELYGLTEAEIEIIEKEI
ncbi:MAG: TaqI-like C-terminal specificity domain-containing protein [Candidatus Peregrinibacteria bacterium]